MHAFLGTERGAQLRSLLARLTQRANHQVRIIGLSATLGDMASAQTWVDDQNPDNIEIIESGDNKTVKYIIKGYRRLKSGEEHVERTPLIKRTQNLSPPLTILA